MPCVQVYTGKLSLVDLAGSERASETNNSGRQLKDGANINRQACSLCIAQKSAAWHVEAIVVAHGIKHCDSGDAAHTGASTCCMQVSSVSGRVHRRLGQTAYPAPFVHKDLRCSIHTYADPCNAMPARPS